MSTLHLKTILAAATARLSGPFATAILTETKQGRLLVPVRDYTVARQLRMKGTYGHDEIARILRFCGPESRVLILGAHIGSIAIPVASHVTAVTAIEASPLTFSLLQANTTLNNASNMTLMNLAASDASGSIDFLEGSANTGGNKRLPAVSSSKYTYDRPSVIKVPAFRLDEVLPGEEFQVALVDIEGSEVFALRGMPSLLAKLDTLIIEFVPHHLRNVADIGVSEFLHPILEHFDQVESPRLNRRAEGASDIADLLQHLMDNDMSDDGLVFEKAKYDAA